MPDVEARKFSWPRLFRFDAVGWVKSVLLTTVAHISKPTAKVATIGIVGLVIDLFWKPLTTGALVMLGMIALPWLLKIVKTVKIAGVEVEAQTPEEVEARIETEVRENEPDAGVAPHEGAANSDQQISGFQLATTAFSFYERLAINRLAALHKGTAKTDVRVGSLMLDAIIETDGRRVAVEVKNVSAARIRKNKLRFLRDVRDQVRSIEYRLKPHGFVDELWLVIIGHFGNDTDEWATLKKLVNDDLRDALPYVRIRLFSTVSDFDQPTNPMYRHEQV